MPRAKEPLDLAVLHIRAADALMSGTKHIHVEHFDPPFPRVASHLTHLLRARMLLNSQIRTITRRSFSPNVQSSMVNHQSSMNPHP